MFATNESSLGRNPPVFQNEPGITPPPLHDRGATSRAAYPPSPSLLPRMDGGKRGRGKDLLEEPDDGQDATGLVFEDPFEDEFEEEEPQDEDEDEVCREPLTLCCRPHVSLGRGGGARAGAGAADGAGRRT